MSATGRGAARQTADAYYTPAWCVERLLERVRLPGGRWLDPAAGEGAIVRAVNALRTDVRWSAVELREECAPPLRALVGPGSMHIANFLELGLSLASERVIITNPPYSLAREFVEACLPSGAFVVMLLRLNWLGTAERAEWLRGRIPDVYVLPDRPSFVAGGTDATEYAWMVWPPFGERRDGRLEILATTPQDVRKRAAKALPKGGERDGAPAARVTTGAGAGQQDGSRRPGASVGGQGA